MLGLILIASSAYSQENQSSLSELWDEVKSNYDGVKAQEFAVSSALAEEKAVKSRALPQLKMQVQSTYGTFEGSNGAFFPQPGFFNVSGNMAQLTGASTASNSFGSATVDFEVFSFGKQRLTNKASESKTLGSRYEKESYLLQLKKELSIRYIEALYQDSKLDWAEKNAERLDEIRLSSGELSRSGLKPAADSLLASSGWIQARADQDFWQGRREASLIKLEELHGIADLDLDLAISRFLEPVYPVPTESGTKVQHPYLQKLGQQKSYFEFQGKAQQRAALPSFKLLAGYSYRGTGIGRDGKVSSDWSDGFSNQSTNYLVGAGITWDLTSLRSNKLKADGFRYQAEQAQSMYAQEELAIENAKSAVRSKIAYQQKQLIKTREAIKQARSAYGMYMARYKSGLISLTELLQTRILLEQAESKQIEASKDYWLQLVEEAGLMYDFDFLFTHL